MLTEQQFQRTGGTTRVRVDLRVIFVDETKNLGAEVAAGRFRAELYHRLNVVPIEVPGLEERLEDIPDLARHFIAKCNAEAGPAGWREITDECRGAPSDDVVARQCATVEEHDRAGCSSWATGQPPSRRPSWPESGGNGSEERDRTSWFACSRCPLREARKGEVPFERECTFSVAGPALTQTQPLRREHLANARISSAWSVSALHRKLESSLGGGDVRKGRCAGRAPRRRRGRRRRSQSRLRDDPGQAPCGTRSGGPGGAGPAVAAASLPVARQRVAGDAAAPAPN